MKDRIEIDRVLIPAGVFHKVYNYNNRVDCDLVFTCIFQKYNR